MAAPFMGSDMLKKKFVVSVLVTFVLLFIFVDAPDGTVSVMEGDSVTLNTGVKKQEDRITWYFNGTRIARITGDQSQICTDVQCKQIFRDRLKLDHQTGSLTITNTRTEDSGDYKLMINSNNEKIFRVSVIERDELKRKSVKEGESVTLDTGVTKNPTGSMMWYFNDILIAEITGDQSKICTDDQCEERFRDRLKLDHQTGSLTITNNRNTDSGLYKLDFINSRFTIIRSFSVSVTDQSDRSDPGSDQSSGVVVGIVVVVLLVFAAAVAGLIYYHRRSFRKDVEKNEEELLNEVQE